MKTQNYPMEVKVSKYKQYAWLEELRIIDPLYRDAVQIFIGDFEKFLEWFIKEEEHAEMRRVNNWAAAFCHISDDGTMVYLNKEKWICTSVLVHELVHVVFHNFSHRVYNPNRETQECQEFFAYKMEFYLDQVLKSRLVRHLL